MSGINRRRFLKIGTTSASIMAAGGGISGLVSEAIELSMGGRQVSRTTEKFRKAIPSTCLLCYARCGIYGYVENGLLMKIGGNPEHPNSRGRMCAKGQAGINFLYDPDRILYPLKRVGARGEGKWRRISWDEAFNEISSRLKSLIDKGHPEEFIFQSTRDITTQDFARRFLNAYGTPNALVNTDLGRENKRLAQELTWGAEIEVNDVAKTHYMLNFGSNPYEAHLLRTSFAQRIQEGRITTVVGERVHHAAKIVTFDVRVSQTAGKSDEWFPIRPGTDGIVILSMANVIMKMGLYNEEFIEKWTNVSVKELSDYLSKYTTEMAEVISGVPVEDILRIAEEFAESKSATTISTGGLTKHYNGTYNERCILLLNAITGNIDVEGGFCLPRTYRLSEPSPIPPSPTIKSELIHPEGYPLAPHEIPYSVLPMIKEGRAKAGIYMTYQHNPVYAGPDCNQTKEILQDESIIPYYVAIDSNMTESTIFADIVLPEAIYLERWELESPPAFERIPFISIRQPVVKPLGEVKSFMEICIELAKRIGGGMEKYFDFATPEDYLDTAILNIDKLVNVGGLYYLMEKGVWYDKDEKPVYRSYEKNGFNTPSGKFEIYSEKMKEHGFDPMPTYLEIPEHQNMKKGELILTTFQWNVFTHQNLANCMWLSEIVHDNPIWINTETAMAMGINDGDKVEVRSMLGTLITTAHVTQGIHPDVVAISDSCGHWEYGGIACGKNFKSKDPNTQLIWWEKQGNGVHPNPIIPIRSDMVGGGQAWMDTVVTVKKV
ncbi:MAG: molybdopterin-dependent oxidoreductase [Nitrospinae bacterium]|nr:molybdopterin-dependent oxidoreductase [Nitrospinota bacterium]